MAEQTALQDLDEQIETLQSEREAEIKRLRKQLRGELHDALETVGRVVNRAEFRALPENDRREVVETALRTRGLLEG